MASAVGDVYEVNLFCVLAEQCAVSRFFYRTTAVAGSGLPSLSDIAVRMTAQLATPLKACMSIAATYRGLRVSQVWPRPRTVEFESVSGQGVGGVAGDPLPRQVRGIITRRTAYAGPAFRGRLYTPFPSEGSNDTDGTPTAAFITSLAALATAMDDVQTAVGTGGNTIELTPILWKPDYVDGQVVSQSFDTIVTCRANDRWATQRRSGSYGSPNISPI